jgi:hypothetical protein
MDIHFSVRDADVELIRSLRLWLDDDPAVRPFGPIACEDPPEPERLGTAMQILSLTVPSAIAAGQLIVAILNWRRSAAAGKAPVHAPPIIVLINGGVTVTIDRNDVDPDEVARRLTEQTP